MVNKEIFEKYLKATNNKCSFLIEDCDRSGLDRQTFLEIAIHFDEYKKLYCDKK